MRLNRNCLEKIYFSFANDLENNIESEEMEETSKAMYQLMEKLVPERKEFMELEEKSFIMRVLLRNTDLLQVLNGACLYS